MATTASKPIQQKSSKAKTDQLQRDLEVMRLRKTGMDLDSIAKKVGFSDRSGVHRSLLRHIKRIQEDSREDTLFVRQLELNRLDGMLEALWGEIEQGNTSAINTGLSIMQRRSSLLGLDAPKEINIQMQVVVWNELLRLFVDLYKQYHEHDSNAPELLRELDRLAQERFSGVPV